MDTGMQQPKKRKRKYRKSTHAILKEEKEALAAEIETLTARLESLKSTTFGAQMEEDDEKDRRCNKLVENRLLRRAVYIQQDNFTSVHALTNAYSLTDMEVGSSLHRFIHLDKDENSRRATLAAIKPEIIARDYSYYSDESLRRISHGDRCRLKTARKAFEALIVYLSNLEISRTEKFGSVTIREDNDGFNADIAQNRLVTTMLSGREMESNTVFFSRFVENGGEADQQRGYGIVVCDFVDEDERYPFHSETRFLTPALLETLV
ncbi:hypothetical protein GQ600_2836 [Phytophthora cactorum]|nr:hypothetical protein GQ600_2836 [Phytophthora cactorum]